MSETRSYYEVLGITKTASADEIRAAFLRIAKTCRPNGNVQDEADLAKFGEASQAYSVLRDARKRSEYDVSGGTNSTLEAHGPLDGFEEIFRQLFGNATLFRPPLPGEDLFCTLEVDAREPLENGRTVAVERLEHCETCLGTGMVPPMVKTCEACDDGYQKARWLVFTYRRKCPTCEGTRWVKQRNCTTCYGEKRVKKLVRVRLDIPEDVKNGHRICLPGKGNTGDVGGKRGDLHVQLSFSESSVRRPGVEGSK